MKVFDFEVYNVMPCGWHIVEGVTTISNEYFCIANNESRFLKEKKRKSGIILKSKLEDRS